MERTRFFRRPVVWIILVIIGAIALSSFFTNGPSYHKVDTSVALERLEQGGIDKAIFQDREQTLRLDLAEPEEFGDTETDRIEAQFPYEVGDEIWTDVLAAKEAGRVTGPAEAEVSSDSIFITLLVNLLPIAILVILLLLFMSQMQGGGSRVLNFGKSKAKVITKDTPKTTFADVAGSEEAVEELQEIKDFLQNPAKYQALGAKIPKGVLLFGPPGTGKTLLARAVAGEAGVPFYSISGSDFVEMFVGVGASRVRDLFEQAKANAPAIVFVDEIDAVGRHRGAGMGGGHDEREQTLNQLLVEMDGFDTKGGVILIAATNRPDILDPALLRPGRFDRQIPVDAPDMEGRKAILRVHARGKPFAPDVDLDAVARRTPGFSGADLANVINEAALLTARQDARAITNEALEESIDRVVAGPQRRTRVMGDKEKKITAYHEGGHALVAWALPHAAPVHKVTILSRGRSLGHTLVLPTEDKYTQTRAEMIDTLAYALGGRAAEELVFHEPTTGAGNDIEKASALARAMVTQYGMSAKLGAVKYGTNGDEPFLGRTMGHERDYSDSIAAEIDSEVRALIELAHDEAWEILVEYRDVLDTMVLELMEKETISQSDMARICERVVKRPPMAPFNGFGKRQPSTEPPVLTPAEKENLGRQAVADGAQAVFGGGMSANSDGTS
ncbi:cell division protease FtsH [Micromonospora sp. Llam0]|uniref:ATP-dependent zinc metalloprotease FtsH n=1 Tax=Micromonosporaceae TaxID=28056 RepID=UPI000F48AA0F|nr:MULTISPECIES: ATP-dependent zinc metalloprotease FtsH [Micromonosporaceae]ROO62827.1 cell division protease FtsH [Micromonospora sp. Llam0]WBB97329.1 ATP-dependent zinc metalloprotease FtsH [Solwaraspora sp. WMMA2059]WBC18769.1 ATP-dependent zinc metalloprotease FtsH [Solwaraspora sp. WMMA2080]